MTVVLLIRHGLTDATGKRLTGWAPGHHLSEQGRAQAASLVERLAPVPVSAIYSSPIERCVETAEPLARARRLEVVRRDALGEIRFGAWTGRALAPLARTKLWRTIQAVPSAARFPDGDEYPGESFVEAQRRAVDEIRAIAAAHPRRVVAAFSHADVIKLALAHFAGAHVDLFQRLVVEPASVSALALSDGVARVVRLNDTGDLSSLAPRRRAPSRKVRG